MVTHAQDEIGMGRELQKPRDLFGHVLAVRVEGDDRVHATLEQDPEGFAQGAALAPVLGKHRHFGPGLPGLLRGPVERAVVDHQNGK